ncbi:MAG: hypothetical protein P8Y70_19320 [Candidatus Lokiarchaeota archaeon]
MCYFGNSWEKETVKNCQHNYPLMKKQEDVEIPIEKVIVAKNK